MNTRLLTLINQPFYIDRNYGESQLPILFNVLRGGNFDLLKDDNKNVSFGKMAAGGDMRQPNINADSYVAVLDFKEPIYKYDQPCGPQGTKTKISILDNLSRDPNCLGIVLDIDSGGGQAYGTPELYDAIREYSKPVVAYTDGLMASAAYYIGSAADEIIANKRAEAIGSIGAYTQFLDLSGFYEKQGATIHEMYASQSTEKNGAIREVMKGNYDKYINEELDPLVDQFIEDMKTARPQIKEKVYKGATYNGKKALKMGLVDQLGKIEDAVNRVTELSNNQSNPNNTMSTKNSYPNLEQVLGLESPLATTDNGSFINEEQKQTIEKKLYTNETAFKNANEKVSEAEKLLTDAEDAHKKELTAAQTETKELQQKMQDLIELSGADVKEDATPEDRHKILIEKIEELNAAPGESHTTGADNGEENEGNPHPYIDTDNSIYQPLKTN